MPKAIDLIGQSFGELKVIEKDQQLTKEKKKTYWICQCSCGRQKSIRGDALKSGSAKTCGQCKIDLTGQKFGRLTVQSRGKTDKAGHIYWFCKCECGNITEVNSDNLRRGWTKSCGCLQAERAHEVRFKDLTGQRFGKLVALEYRYNKDTKKTHWLCQCDCGRQAWIPQTNLSGNITQSCGCINYSIGESNIVNILKTNNIPYIKEYIFKELSNRRYDFYLPESKRLIEFDGKQHFEYINNWYKTKEDFSQAQQRDKEKNQYALSHNIPLVRIPYWERDNITLEMILGDKYLIKETANAPDMEEAEEN